MKRRILAALLIFCMCMTAPSWGGMTVMAAEEEPDLIIENEEQLIAFAQFVNNGDDDYAGKYVKLGDNITLTKPWEPMGEYSEGKNEEETKKFSGTFDGAGHTITGLSITSNTSSSVCVGLFGYVNGGTIQNLTVKGEVTVVGKENIDIYVGGIVGHNQNGTVKNCRSEVSVKVENTSDPHRIYIGGIVGYNEGGGTVTDCRNHGDVEIDDSDGSGNYAGGIVGQDKVGRVENCRNHGDVKGIDNRTFAGGIVGGNNTPEAPTTIENCQNEGGVTGDHAGGIMGRVSNGYGIPVEGIQAKIENCWNEGDVTGERRAGGIMVYNSSAENAIIKNCGNKGTVMCDNARYVGEILGPFGNETTITNCYYLNDTENTGIAGKDDEKGQVEGKTEDEFKSGEVTWLLQKGQENQDDLVWGQRLTGDPKDDFPRLACFMGKDDAKWVYRVTFHHAEDAAGYEEYETYANQGSTVELLGKPDLSDVEIPDGYKAVWLDSRDNPEKIYGEDTEIEKDTELYLFYKETFGSEGGTITTSYGTSETKNLDDYITYEKSGTEKVAGNFTYKITAGNDDTLKASVEGSILTIPSTAASGSHELTIEATENESPMENQQERVTGFNIDSITFTVKVIIDTDKGIVEKETQSGKGAPRAELPMETEEMADAVFTEKERQEIEEGKDIKLLLTVDNIEEDKVSAGDAEKIEKGAAYYTVGQYLDIELLKVVTDKEQNKETFNITTTVTPIRITIQIPESLKGEGDKVRTYAVVRLHNGEATLLEDLDNDPDTITIETNRFSTYAMAYTELTNEDRVAGAEEKLPGILDGLTATNDTTKEDMEKQIHDKLAEAGYGDVTVAVEITEREAATTEKEGKLRGTVTIKKGDASGQTMPWEAVIGKVKKTPVVTPTAAPDENSDNDKYKKVGLIAELKVTQKKKKIQAEWGKVSDADGYLVYVQYCGKKFAKKATKTIKKSSTTNVNIAKVGGKKLKLKKNFKVYVAAYKIIGGKRVVIKKTMTGHIVGKKNYKYTNAKKVNVTKSKFTLQVGKTAKIKAKTVHVDKKKKLLPTGHGRKYRYKSTNTSVAKVSKSGKITAVGKGACSVYVFAQNGCAKKIKVTAKMKK
ncbi:MAG: Ig-like domain-containing protein [Lachnospiraceae bacterium]|nr:Ig-like domain-containing protein [Lachnospiraceae bacterium]